MRGRLAEVPQRRNEIWNSEGRGSGSDAEAK
jgi:hypothetical protein